MADRDHRVPKVRFSTAELRVLPGIARGETYRSIAATLYLTPSTIAFHASQLRARLGAANNAALVALAVAAGLLSVSDWPFELTGLTDVYPVEFGQTK